ncbi:MAG: glyoxalase [Ketobacter sp.]|nr:MAG: glyoxalase [Ketobacter sp.]
MINAVDIYNRIDHVAIAVKDLEAAVDHYCNVLGFSFVERRETHGESTGMISAVLEAKSFTVVLIQGTSSRSQVSRFIEEYGPGIQHMAIEVDDVEAVTKTLEETGTEFSTNVIRSNGLVQRFTKREPISGVMFEYIQRTEHDGYEENNINSLFSQLEEAEAY